MMYDTPERRWAAVRGRDAAADSAFVYAVLTTHIYCRPTCPSRLARRANIEFFNTPADAAAASYRPCKRCKPDEVVLVSRAAQLVTAAQIHIRDQNGEVTLDQLAEHLNISPRYLHHIFSKSVGCTPAAYASKFKVRSKQLAPVLVSTDVASQSTTSSASPASGLGHLESNHQLPWMEPVSDTIPDPWLDFGATNHAIASDLTLEELDLLWQTYDQSIDVSGEDQIWTTMDFENTLLDPLPVGLPFDGSSS